MYGLINEAIAELVTLQFGEGVWREIQESAGIEATAFTRLNVYPDESTYRLVEAISAHSGLTAEQVLELFGRYWIQYSAKGQFQSYFRFYATGESAFSSLLLNLAKLHAALQETLPQARMPQFECDQVGEGHLRLSYRSCRRGLAPMVTGLILGLSDHFETPCEVTCQEPGDWEGAHIYDIRLTSFKLESGDGEAIQ